MSGSVYSIYRMNFGNIVAVFFINNIMDILAMLFVSIYIAVI